MRRNSTATSVTFSRIFFSPRLKWNQLCMRDTKVFILHLEHWHFSLYTKFYFQNSTHWNNWFRISIYLIETGNQKNVYIIYIPIFYHQGEELFIILRDGFFYYYFISGSIIPRNTYETFFMLHIFKLQLYNFLMHSGFGFLSPSRHFYSSIRIHFFSSNFLNFFL